MKLLTRYLNRIVLVRLTVVTIAMVLFAMLFDLMDASDDLIRRDGPAIVTFGHYFVLRFPSMLNEILPFAALVGSLFAAAELMRNGELTVFWASGISPLGVVLRLLPICLLVLGIKLANDDLLVPGTVQELRSWQVGFFSGGVEGFVGDDLWVASDTRFIRLPRLDWGKTEVDDVLILERDEVGNLVERTTVAHAVLEPGAWRLFGVERSRVGDGRIVREDERRLREHDRPRAAARRRQPAAGGGAGRPRRYRPQ